MAKTSKKNISSDLAKVLKGSLKKLIKLEFAMEAGPDGTPWPPGKDGKPLEETGKLKNSFVYTSDNSSASVTNTVPYFIQATKNKPVFPEGSTVPTLYTQVFNKDIKTYLDKEFKKAIWQK